MWLSKKSLSDSLFMFLKKRIERVNCIDVNAKIGPRSWISGCTIEGDVSIGECCKLYKTHLSGEISIQRFTSLWGPGVFLNSKKSSIEIGSFCSIARNVAIYESFHNPDRTTTYFIERNVLKTEELEDAEISKGKIDIGNDVWIGDSAILLSGISIGDGAIIAAGAVIASSVPPYAIVAGNPARIIRYRFSDRKIDELMSIKWWDWSEEKIIQESSFLTEVHKRTR